MTGHSLHAMWLSSRKTAGIDSDPRTWIELSTQEKEAWMLFGEDVYGEIQFYRKANGVEEEDDD